MVYVHRFNDKAMQVDDYTNQVAFQGTMNGLLLNSFKWEMFKKMPKSLSNLIEKA